MEVAWGLEDHQQYFRMRLHARRVILLFLAFEKSKQPLIRELFVTCRKIRSVFQ